MYYCRLAKGLTALIDAGKSELARSLFKVNLTSVGTLEGALDPSFRGGPELNCDNIIEISGRDYTQGAEHCFVRIRW